MKPGGQGLGTGYGSRLHHYPLSKKFLWEELELVREEVTFIYQKLRECPEPTGLGGRDGGVLQLPGLPESPPLTGAQEEEITENLVNIQKMQKTQVKCRKVRGEDRDPTWVGNMGISASLHHWTGAKRPGHKSQLCYLLLCDCGQVSSPLWASFSSSV